MPELEAVDWEALALAEVALNCPRPARGDCLGEDCLAWEACRAGRQNQEVI
ncbi:MAG TPA: hypothetical protein VK150_01705 [Geothrix sp.]|nr:hypothetical protein [Geothrix sp.]